MIFVVLLNIAVGSRREKSGRCVANVWQVCGSWSFQCGNVPGLSVREGGRCVVSAWQLSVSRQVCLTIGLMKIMVEKPPKL